MPINNMYLNYHRLYQELVFSSFCGDTYIEIYTITFSLKKMQPFNWCFYFLLKPHVALQLTNYMYWLILQILLTLSNVCKNRTANSSSNSLQGILHTIHTRHASSNFKHNISFILVTCKDKIDFCGHMFKIYQQNRHKLIQ